VARGDAQERECWPLGHASPLLPVAEGVDADAHRAGEQYLRQPEVAPQVADVLGRLEGAPQQPAERLNGDGPRELGLGELGDLFYVRPPMS
jgi:hypothetical protein